MGVIDPDKYVKFSYYNNNSLFNKYSDSRWKNKPTFVKGKIVGVRCSPKGLLFCLEHIWIGYSRGNKQYYGVSHRTGFCFEARNIRWEEFPFDWDKINEKCMELVKQLPESTSGRALIPIPESANY